MRRRYVPKPRRKPQHNINRFIRAKEVRLIDQHGEQRGVVPTKEALMLAEEAELDLVEVAPNAKPPVCKIEDYRKVLYEKKKRERSAKKKHKTIEMKEVKVRPSIGQNDFDIKMNHARKFLDHGNKVKVTMMFRGREIPTADRRGAVLRERVMETLGEHCEQESYSRHSARQMVMILAPKKNEPEKGGGKGGGGGGGGGGNDSPKPAPQASKPAPPASKPSSEEEE